MKAIFPILASLPLALLPAGAAENETCPVSGKSVDPDATAKYVTVIGFCCGKCQAKYEESPEGEKFAAARKEAAGAPVNSKCPISGRDIDAEKTVFHDGMTVGFCCGDCVAEFEEDPSKHVAEVKADRPANEKCPISGEEVDASTAVKHVSTIGFCCNKCVAKFKEDPAAVLE